jgi:hypothetical protein
MNNPNVETKSLKDPDSDRTMDNHHTHNTIFSCDPGNFLHQAAWLMTNETPLLMEGNDSKLIQENFDQIGARPYSNMILNHFEYKSEACPTELSSSKPAWEGQHSHSFLSLASPASPKEPFSLSIKQPYPYRLGIPQEISDRVAVNTRAEPTLCPSCGFRLPLDDQSHGSHITIPQNPLHQATDISIRCEVLKPLNAYNYFFRDEQANLTRGATRGILPPPVDDWSECKKQKLLHERWCIDPSKPKRKHRKKEIAVPFTQ